MSENYNSCSTVVRNDELDNNSVVLNLTPALLAAAEQNTNETTTTQEEAEQKLSSISPATALNVKKNQFEQIFTKSCHYGLGMGL